jgi:hypothetical protein
MITVPELAAEALGSFLSTQLSRRFWSTQAHLTEIIPSVARLALECIGNSDALYHNVEHTMLVTLVGYNIMKGRVLLTPTTPDDFAHLLIACLLHDIGYVRGILKGDSADGYIIDARGKRANVPRGSSDAALLQHHVDRSKLFVMDRISTSEFLDADRIASAIEFTRFPTSALSRMMTMKRVRLCALLTSLGNSVIRNICEKRMRFIMSLRRRASTSNSATDRPRTSRNYIRNFTGTPFLRTSKRPFDIST